MALTEKQIENLENKLPEILDEFSVDPDLLANFATDLVISLLRKEHENQPIEEFLGDKAEDNMIPIPYLTPSTTLDLDDPSQVREALRQQPVELLIEGLVTLISEKPFISDEFLAENFLPGLYPFHSKEE